VSYKGAGQKETKDTREGLAYLESPEGIVAVCILPHKEPCSLSGCTQHVLCRQALGLRYVTNLKTHKLYIVKLTVINLII